MGRKQEVALAARGKTVFSQADAAEFLGVPVRTYQAWERESSPKVPIAFVREAVLGKIGRTYRIKRKRRYR